jgi:serine/threonine protein kinase/formylglycine-generating enzyme required for sulfatase activity
MDEPPPKSTLSMTPVPEELPRSDSPESVPETGLGVPSVLSLLMEEVIGGAPAASPGRDSAGQLRDSGPREKYQLASTIGSGGMGMVLKAFDADLRRWVAMKVVRRDLVKNPEQLSRFVEEAQVCGQLEHPNIPPVHEIGAGPDGQVYFTMKLVKGRTLREIARDLSLGRPDVRREFTPIRIAQILQQAAMGVHYANARGVIHRDLKPDNIMVGDYGEVLVMDWGLAKVLGEECQAQLHGEDPVITARTESGLHTRDGAVQGTPSYMSPEQACGELDVVDARTDVFGLGAVLYELLCYQPPFLGGSFKEILAAAKEARCPPPSKVAPKGALVPPDLEAICLKAMAAAREDRHADARELQNDLQSFIEGTTDRERRRAEALALVAEGRKLIASYKELENRRQQLRIEAAKAAEVIAPYEPVAKKKALWAVDDAVEALEGEAQKAYSRARAAFDAALQHDPACKEARRALTDLYWERFLEAEAQRSSRDAAFYRDLVEANDDGRYAARLKGDGSLSVESSPAGAEAILYRYREEERILKAMDPRPLGSTPIRGLPLPMGSYLVVLRSDGRRETRLPVHIGRSQDLTARADLLREEEIGTDFVYVPAGEFMRGGDAESMASFERSSVHLESFFIARFPVTFREYCDFLDALLIAGEEVREHIPRMAEEVYIELDARGRHRPAAGMLDDARRGQDPDEAAWSCPVLAVNWYSAMEYARWRSSLDGRPYTLPPEEAWEKAARGADGRFYPWGDRFDWTFTKGGLSRPGRASPEPVRTFAADESPYGVRDLAGTIREWTSSWFSERDQTRALRGGSWNVTAARLFRSASRFGYRPEARASTFGFRLFSWQKAGER